MSTVRHLLSRVNACGVTVSLSADKCNLKFRGLKQAIDPETLARLKEHKAEIVRLLRNKAQPPSITAFEERAAILEFDAGMSRHAANMAAAKEFGFLHPRALFTAVINSWRAEIEALELIRPASDAEQLIAREFTALKNAKFEFLDGEFALAAVSSGWCEIQIFGVHEGSAPAARCDAFGLIPALAFSVLGCTLADIGPEHALVPSATGATLKHSRFRANHNEAVAWWQHPHFSGKENVARD